MFIRPLFNHDLTSGRDYVIGIQIIPHSGLLSRVRTQWFPSSRPLAETPRKKNRYRRPVAQISIELEAADWLFRAH